MLRDNVETLLVVIVVSLFLLTSITHTKKLHNSTIGENLWRMLKLNVTFIFYHESRTIR